MEWIDGSVMEGGGLGLYLGHFSLFSLEDKPIVMTLDLGYILFCICSIAPDNDEFAVF